MAISFQFPNRNPVEQGRIRGVRVRGLGLRKFSAVASMPDSLAFLFELQAAEQFDRLKSLTFFKTLGV